jgi:Mlc titration factor MtfA (ptsG expression regulator)
MDPGRLHKQYPRVYKELASYYRQSPLKNNAEELAESALNY